VISKSTLRTDMRARRRRLVAEAPDAALRAAANLPADWPGTPVATFGLYPPIGSELDPGAIRIAGARAALPVVVERDAPLAFRLYSPGDALEPDALGILAPTSRAETVWPDVLFVPVLAFDGRGGRLGQGGGFYDRTIAALRARGPVWVVGVAYAGQEVEDLPFEPHDQRLDAILTEAGFRLIAAA
jgi:5-formyltetrahydrofolate cyclo-ligase